MATITDRESLGQLAEAEGWDVNQGYTSSTYTKGSRKIFVSFHRFGAFRWSSYAGSGSKTTKINDVKFWLGV
ncbi:hypothetical protein SEA_CHILL_54 [Mycobacterium phage Chill]|uniref:Uncharacterized protein n=9 Tax=Plotvirus TaxID=2169613 RepID=B5U418_9CAUD|nr:gp52 [Mycobacterium phage Troll4]YP_655245.1 gp49 [Mycobacterium phage PBI1]ACD49636.1 hypothetical protein Adjutor_51 [Mycobacterium phage Adjutor]ACI06339.1 hypothetical protein BUTTERSCOTCH_51 [Mycobacterium phage Butterscotch]AVP43148.1 hypothetical protein PBI_BIGMAMA_50 [Mycobacterium phage BigMama]AXC38545.1 hypothetical protein SEA_VISCONTI_53 [Mycobacterium phage Visconti]QBI97118.1 hypothetical protein SEA_CHILL_54 [Mycobacterium phage Chill]QBP30051.1 hypothetical protein SEA_W